MPISLFLQWVFHFSRIHAHVERARWSEWREFVQEYVSREWEWYSMWQFQRWRPSKYLKIWLLWEIPAGKKISNIFQRLQKNHIQSANGGRRWRKIQRYCYFRSMTLHDNNLNKSKYAIIYGQQFILHGNIELNSNRKLCIWLIKWRCYFLYKNF